MAKLTFGWGMFRQLFDWTDPDNVQIKADYLANAADAVVTVSASLTAYASGGQGSATAIVSDFTNIATAASGGASVKLPAAVAGKSYTIVNNGANYVDVFPATGDTINGGSANAAIKLPVGASYVFTAINATDWKTNLRVTASASFVSVDSSMFAGFIPNAAQDNITAGTGGAIAVTNYLTTINTDAGGDAFTLANGTYAGQLKKILLVTDGGGDGVVTPATAFAGGATTATFNDANDYLLLMWNGSAWRVVENSGVTVA